MNEDMNRFAFNTEGKICDYGEEEPKVLSEQEILEELNHLENTKNHFWEECEDMNWQNECLQENIDTIEKTLDKFAFCLKLACEDLYRFCKSTKYTKGEFSALKMDYYFKKADKQRSKQ